MTRSRTPLQIARWTALSCGLMLACGCAGKVKNRPPRNDTVCCFGDSLVAGNGAESPAQSYPAQLAKLLNCPVSAWGTPGATTADGLADCGRFADARFGIVIVTFGGNDILQRRDWKDTEHDLHRLLKALTDAGSVVAFTGVTGPLNPSRNRLYRQICRAEGVLYIPDVLRGIVTNPELKGDEIHPNGAGYRLMAERVAEALQQAGIH